MDSSTFVTPLPSRLRELRPEAVALLEAANECAGQAIDARLLSLIRLRVDALVGDGALSSGRTANSNHLTPAQVAALAFTDQFVIDVSGLTEADRDALASHFPGEAKRELVTSAYIVEATYRLDVMARELLGSDDTAPANAVAKATIPAADVRRALRDYQDAVVRGTDLDPVTTELVRLRCARTHNCRICQTLRLADARQAGADDEMTAKVDFYERSDLDEPLKVALRITDAFITRPDTLPEGTADTAAKTYTPAQLAELCLDITKWSTQKIHVALGTDGADAVPKNEQGVSFFGFDADGRVAGYSATAGVVSR